MKGCKDLVTNFTWRLLMYWTIWTHNISTSCSIVKVIYMTHVTWSNSRQHDNRFKLWWFRKQLSFLFISFPHSGVFRIFFSMPVKHECFNISNYFSSVWKKSVHGFVLLKFIFALAFVWTFWTVVVCLLCQEFLPCEEGVLLPNTPPATHTSGHWHPQGCSHAGWCPTSQAGTEPASPQLPFARSCSWFEICHVILWVFGEL